MSKSSKDKIEKKLSPVKTSQIPSFTTEKSDKIVKKIKLARFKQFFEDLLPNSKGCINKETIYKSKIDSKIKEIIKPLLNELENFDESLNFEDFCDAMEVLLRSIGLAEKNFLLNTTKKKTNNEESDFKPKINKKRVNSCIFSRSVLENSSKSPEKSQRTSFMEFSKNL